MSYRVRVGDRANQQIRQAQDWWLENRSQARPDFAEQIESALELLREVPSAGEPVPRSRVPNLRRVLLSRIRYFLYYSVDEKNHITEVLALWHTSRGQAPKI